MPKADASKPIVEPSTVEGPLLVNITPVLGPRSAPSPSDSAELVWWS